MCSSDLVVVSMDGVIGIRRLVQLVFALVKERLRYDVLFRRPVAKILQAAAIATKRKIGVCFGGGQRLANRAPALHEDQYYPKTRSAAPVEMRVSVSAAGIAAAWPRRAPALALTSRTAGRGKISTTRPIKS